MLHTGKGSSSSVIFLFNKILVALLIAAFALGSAPISVFGGAQVPNIALIVTNPMDVLDAGPCNLILAPALPGPDGLTSLRESICVANNTPLVPPGIPHLINFAIPPGSIIMIGMIPPTVGPLTPITAPMVILALPPIIIDGSFAGPGNGLTINNTIGAQILGLVIQNFVGNGIEINGGGQTLIQNTHIGIDIGGVVAHANGGNGIQITDSISNLIGGPAISNIISGNTSNGIKIQGSLSTSNIIQGNYIGTDFTGLSAVPNGATGVYIDSASSNTIGGVNPGAGNLISGNTGQGVFIESNQASYNLVQGNLIGTDVHGTVDLGNSLSGVWISGAITNTIGGAVSGARNVISGNDQNGVLISGDTAFGNMVYSNTIGTNITGTFAISNTASGIDIVGAPRNRIGAAGMGNLISGNGATGVRIFMSQAQENLVVGNIIGTNISGSSGIPNQLYGILIYDAITNTIGGTNSQDGNLISANQMSGIYIQGDQANGNLVLGNKIGTNKAGEAALGNQYSGIYIYDGSRNTIGGSASGAGNLISGNLSSGVEIYGSEARYNKLLGNKIGTNLAGTSAVPNSNAGIILDPARDTIIGGAVVGEGNLISGNSMSGIFIFGDDSFNNTVMGNKIGTNLSGSAALENGVSGISINNAPKNTIGGTTAGSGNLISGNHMHGIEILNTEASQNALYGNVIGLNASGTFTIPNKYSGIYIQDAISTTVGGIDPGQANTIAGNLKRGVNILNFSGESLYNRVSGNSIFQNGDLGIDLDGIGVTPNDNQDLDNGPNKLQNYPLIQLVTVPESSLYSLATTIIAGELNSTITTTFTIEFYSSPTCDPSGYGEGKVFLGTRSVQTDGSGKVDFSFTTNFSTTVGEFLTALAIDPQGDTSEFSGCRRIDAAVLYLPVIRR